MSIYTNVVSLVNGAISNTQDAASEFEYSPPAITIPAVQFSTSIDGTVPAPPTATPSLAALGVSSAPSGSLEVAAYNAISSALGSLSVGTIPALNYASPVPADALPAPTPPTGVGIAPEAGFIDVLDNAGLTPVTAPVIVIGDPAALQLIPELDYEVYGLEKLAAVLPPVVNVPSAEELANPEQLVVQVDPALLAAMANTMGGQDIMPILAEMFELATEKGRRERVDVERRAFTASAANGFDDSNGPLFETLADLHYAATEDASKGFTESRDELFATAQTKLVAAVSQAIALETANFAVHLSYASKLIEVYEINIKLYADIFNIVVDMYQTQLTGVATLISSYNAYVSGVLAEQSAKSAEIEQFQAEVRTDQAKVSMFEAQIQTAEAQTDVYVTSISQETLKIQEYSTYIDGLMQNVNLVKLNIDAYKDALRAYSLATKADSAIIDAYAAQVRTEGSVVDVYKENWDLYGAANAAVTGQNNAVQTFNNASLAAVRSEIGVFNEAVTEQRAYLAAISAWVSANNAIASDYERGVASAARFYTSKNAVTVDLSAATSNLALSQASLAAVESSLAAQRDAAQATIDAGLAASEATTYAGQAQAAYAIRSVNAQLDSTASDTDAQSFSSKASEGTFYRRSYTHTKVANVST